MATASAVIDKEQKWGGCFFYATMPSHNHTKPIFADISPFWMPGQIPNITQNGIQSIVYK
jgi:hypothetical protein